MIFNALLYAGLVPLAVAAAVGFGLRRMRVQPPVVCAAGVALGYLAGYLALGSRSSFGRAVRSLTAPRDSSEWLPHAVLLALGVSILAAYAPRSWRSAVVGLAALLAIGVPARLLAGAFAQRWSALEQASHLALLSAALGLVWLLLAAAHDDPLPRLRQVLLVLSAVATAVVAALSGSIAVGRLCGVVAAALAGIALVAPRGQEGAAGVVVCSLGGLVIVGAYLAQLSTLNAVLLFLAIAAAAGRMPDGVSSWPVSRQATLRAAVCLTFVAGALLATFAETAM